MIQPERRFLTDRFRRPTPRHRIGSHHTHRNPRASAELAKSEESRKVPGSFFFSIAGTTRATAASREIAETSFSGVFWIRPLVGVSGRPSRVKDPR